MKRALAAVLPVLVLSLAGCASDADPVGTPSASSASTQDTPSTAGTPGRAEEPKTLEAATASMQENADRFSSGDFAGSWELMSKEIRDGISQEDYVTLNETCKTVGLPIAVKGVRMVGDDEAVVRMEVAGFKSSRTMVYEDGGWYQEPTSDFRKQLGKPVEEIIAEDRAAGACSGG